MSFRMNLGHGDGLVNAKSQTNSEPSTSFLMSDPNRNDANMSKIPIPGLRKKARELEMRMAEALDQCSSTDFQEVKNFELMLSQLRLTQSILDQLVQVNQALSNSANESGLDSSQSGIHFHQDKLRYYTQSFRRLKNAWEEKRQREELFNHAAHQQDEKDDQVSVSMKTMLADSNSLSNSSRAVHSIIDNGQEVKELIMKGRHVLQNATGRIRNSILRFSSIESALRTIKRAQLKNTVIIGIVIGLCMCVFIYMMMR